MILKRFFLPTACLFLGVPLLGVPATAAIHPSVGVSVPPDSFLNYHAATVAALSREVTLDPAVRGRLANHFHVTEAQITQYIRQNLVLTHLPKAGTYQVACVSRTGRDYWLEARLPAGTPVFASRATGRPILKLACGNPMVSALPSVERGPFTPAQLAAVRPLPAPTLAALTPGLMPADLPAPTLLAAGSDIVSPPIIEVAPSLEGFTTPVVGSVGHAFNFFAPVLAGGLALAVASGGGGGAAPTPAIPEASTTVSFGLLLALGLGAMAVAKKRKQTA